MSLLPPSRPSVRRSGVSLPKDLSSHRHGRVLELRFSDPPHNYLTPEIVAGLESLLRRLNGNREIGAVVLTGTGEAAFSTHFAPDSVGSAAQRTPLSLSPRAATVACMLTSALHKARLDPLLERTPAQGLLTLERLRQVHLAINRAPQVFVAAINGAAMGAALELALACDARLAAEGDYPLGFPEAHLGICLPAGGPRRLAHILGPARAIDLLLSGRVLTPTQAHAAGLVDDVVPLADLLSEARRLADSMARLAPMTVRAYKTAVNEGATLALRHALRIDQAMLAAATTQAPAQRAMEVYANQIRELGEDAYQPETILGPWERGEMTNLNPAP